MITYSIIIPTCNRPKDLALCLEPLCAQARLYPEVEILVTDDSSSPETRLMVEREFRSVSWLQGPRRGPAANRNAGARTAQGTWLIFVDDDCLPREKFISAYLDAIQRVAVQRTVLNGPTYRMETPPSLLWEAPHNPEGVHLISCNFAIARAELFAVGGFDERYPMAIFEDTEFAARLGLAGTERQFVSAAAVDHPLRPIPAMAKLARRWESRVISSYDFGMPPVALLWRLPKHVALVILSRFRQRPLSRENIRAAALFLGEFFGFLVRLPGWALRHRKTSRSPFWRERIGTPAIPPNYGL